jgi:predicted adenylyl cyclase CyaB
MEDLGFVRWMRKLKLGESYNHKKDKRITIELNYVKNLGYFIEIEYLAKKHEIKKAIRKIISTLSELEISKDQIDNTGYTKMLWKKGKKDTKYFKSLK